MSIARSFILLKRQHYRGSFSHGNCLVIKQGFLGVSIDLPVVHGLILLEIPSPCIANK